MPRTGARNTVLIRGGGEMATGVAVTLFRSGFRIAICEVSNPRAIRRSVAFAAAIYDRGLTVESIRAEHVGPEELEACWRRGVVPVVIDPEAELRRKLQPDVLVDAILSKRNVGGTARDWASLVIGLGPGFTAGEECHLVVETHRGHYLGRIYDHGTVTPDTGSPGEVAGESDRRVLRATADGALEGLVRIGESVGAGDRVARTGHRDVRTEIAGVLRGMMADGCLVTTGDKIGDVDPRDRPEYCRYISDKARLIGSAVLSAILWDRAGRPGGPLPPPPPPA